MADRNDNPFTRPILVLVALLSMFLVHHAYDDPFPWHRFARFGIVLAVTCLVIMGWQWRQKTVWSWGKLLLVFWLILVVLSLLIGAAELIFQSG